jgi:anti-sigma-K factor RskA
MNVGQLQQKMIAAARRQAPDERVPYAFEKRIMALIEARALADRWSVWSRGLWRAAVSCAAIAAVAVVASIFMPASNESGDDLSQDFENTLLASADQPDTSLIP